MAVSEPDVGPLPRPATTEPPRVQWSYALTLSTVHLLSLLACLPWFFSWTGVMLVVIGHHVFGLLGITLGYHRLLTHRGFTCPLWLEHTLGVLGVCCLQDSPARWVATHRQHHQYPDQQNDPHSPLVAVFWGHMGWLLIENREHQYVTFLDRYASDLLRDPFFQRLERRLAWFKVYVLHAVPFFLAGLAIGWTSTGNWRDGVQFGSSLLVWGVFVRTVFVWHFTWTVNSLAHVWGYRNYATNDNSRNNWISALVADGEGWHNNHHADPRSAAHGHRWWEFDLTWTVIRLLESVGLAKDVVRPRCWDAGVTTPHLASGARRHTVDRSTTSANRS